MPTHEQRAPSVADNPDLAQLLVRAREEGDPDAFPIKRNWKRYVYGAPLELKTVESRDSGDADRDAIHPATMHDLSGGGFALWSHVGLAAGSRVLVREWCGETERTWHAAVIVHCEQGLRGFLIGGRFDEPLPVDAFVSTPQTTDASGDSEEETLRSEDYLPEGEPARDGWVILFGTLAAAAILVRLTSEFGLFG